MSDITIGGRRVHYQLHGSGDPIVWVAGTGQPGALWLRHQVAHFRERYLNVVFDLPGTGDSDAPQQPCTPAWFAGVLCRLVESIGLDSATFVGLSLGSAIVQELALMKPSLVSRAVLIATWSQTSTEHHLRRWFEGRMETVRAGGGPQANAMSFWLWSQTLIEDEPELIESLEAFHSSIQTPQPIACRLAHYEADLAHDTRNRLAKVSCPVLVLHGAEDLITLPRHNRTVSERIPGAALTAIPNAGHLCNLERPDLVNEAIDGFLVAQALSGGTRYIEDSAG
jgi:pimeloyl-ACP methyl ester carboxylesterase